ncbi:hypothetical protein AB0I55_07445 [Actinocatenispora sera]|uniref:hypothetical protein n=1 Tax=Actinocatenispora sera TaxID=390989 RepID=UPI0033F6E350
MLAGGAGVELAAATSVWPILATIAFSLLIMLFGYLALRGKIPNRWHTTGWFERLSEEARRRLDTVDRLFGGSLFLLVGLVLLVYALYCLILFLGRLL